MKTLLTSGCTNQRGAGHISCPSCSATDGVVRNGKSTAG
ncbi:IS1 family transposase, partial [Escherichia coli]